MIFKAEMNKKLFVVFIFALVIFAGCGGNNTQPAPQENVLVDDLGQRVAFLSAPGRIVSLVPGNTEMVVAMGDIKKIAGVTLYDDLPQIKERIQKGDIVVVGDGLDPPVEKIAALNPDLVLTDGKSQSRIAEKLHEVNMKTFSLDPRSVKDILDDFTKVGKILRREKEAQEFHENFSRLISRFFKKRKTGKVSVYFEMWDNPIMTIGKTSLENELIELCGGENIFKDVSQNVFKVNAEAVIGRNPDVIIMARETGIPYAGVEKRKAWNSVKAVKNKKVYNFDSGLLRRGPQILQAFKKICHILNDTL